MKRIIFCILCSVFFKVAQAQWTTSGVNISNSNTGNVGIGTTSPGCKLHVSGGAMAAANTDMSGFVQLWSDNAIIYRSGSSSTGLRFGSATDLAAANFTERMRLMDNGNLGLGTSTPGNKLEINVVTASDGLKIGYSTTGFVRLHPNSLAVGAYNPIIQAGDAGLVYGGSTVGAVNFGFVISPWASAKTGIRLDQNGNVGINTASTQGYQLAVNGSAIFTSAFVKRYTNWPDYVFDQKYVLLSLDSVARYIRDNCHLPDMPSAEDISQKGIDLGGTQTALLKKIEELTLYIIAQEKELDRLKANERKMEMQGQLLEKMDSQVKIQQEKLERLEKFMSIK